MKRLAEYSIGIIIISLGVAFMLYSGRGVSTFDAISHNLRYMLNIDIGVAVFASSMTVILIAFIINPQPQVFLSIVCTVLISLLISGFEKLVVLWLPINQGLTYLYMILGVLLIPIGAALMIESNYPPSSVDIFLKAANEKYNIKIGVLKYMTEIFFLIVAVILGLFLQKTNTDAGFGIGLGTIVLASSSGILMQITLNLLRRRNKNED